MTFALLIASSFVGFRIYRLAKSLKLIGGLGNLEIKLTNWFFFEQSTGLFFLCLFLVALDPVPAYLAIAMLIGFFVDTIFTLIYYSAKKSLSTVS